MFLAPWKPKTTVFTVFLAPDSKNHVIYNVFRPGHRENTGIYAVFSMLQEERFSCQRRKNTVNYTIFTHRKNTKNQPNINPKSPKMDHQNASWNFTIVFPTPNPQKQPEGFWGRVGGRGAPPASSSYAQLLHTARRGTAGFEQKW